MIPGCGRIVLHQGLSGLPGQTEISMKEMDISHLVTARMLILLIHIDVCKIPQKLNLFDMISTGLS